MTARQASGAIGIFGGTFDPIHFGHLRPALEVFEALDLSELRFVPSGDPPHRDKPHAPAAFRRALVATAIAGQAGFTVDDRELERPGPHYTVDTLASLRGEFPNVPLCLVVGSDAFLSFMHWRDPQGILALAHVVIMHRPGADLPHDGPLGHLVAARGVRDAKRLHESPAGGVHCVPVTPLEISASQIRERLAQGKSLRWLIPETVWEMIRSSEYYRANLEA